MKKYKLNVKHTHNGTTTTYTDDVFFTNMISDVMNSKLLSNVTTESNKLEHLTGGVIIYTTQLDKSVDNIAPIADELTYKLLPRNGKVTMNSASGHVGAICMTTKQNINSHSQLKANSQALETYKTAFEMQDDSNIYKFEDLQSGILGYDSEVCHPNGWEYSNDMPQFKKYTASINDIYASISNNRNNVADAWDDGEYVKFSAFSDLYSDLSGTYSESGYSTYTVDVDDGETPVADKVVSYTIRCQTYTASDQIIESCNVYDEGDYFYFFYNTYYVKEIKGIYIDKVIRTAYRSSGEGAPTYDMELDYMPNDLLNIIDWADFEDNIGVENNDVIYYGDEGSSTTIKYWKKDPINNMSKTIQCKNRIVKIEKSSQSQETIDWETPITSLNLGFNYSILSNNDCYCKYNNPSKASNYQRSPAKGVAVVLGATKTLPLATHLVATDDNYYYFRVYEGNNASNTFNDVFYKVNKTNYTISSTDISTINSINNNHTSYRTFRPNYYHGIYNTVLFYSVYFNGNSWNSSQEHGSYTKGTNTTINDLTNYERKICRKGGLNGVCYVYYPGICSISNFDINLEASDTLEIEFKAGEYDEN